MRRDMSVKSWWQGRVAHAVSKDLDPATGAVDMAEPHKVITQIVSDVGGIGLRTLIHLGGPPCRSMDTTGTSQLSSRHMRLVDVLSHKIWALQTAGCLLSVAACSH